MRRAEARVRGAHASTGALSSQCISRAPVIGLTQGARISRPAFASVLKAAVATAEAWQPGGLWVAAQHDGAIDTAEALAAGAGAIVLADAGSSHALLVATAVAQLDRPGLAAIGSCPCAGTSGAVATLWQRRLPAGSGRDE